MSLQRSSLQMSWLAVHLLELSSVPGVIIYWILFSTSIPLESFSAYLALENQSLHLLKEENRFISASLFTIDVAFLTTTCRNRSHRTKMFQTSISQPPGYHIPMTHFKYWVISKKIVSRFKYNPMITSPTGLYFYLNSSMREKG